MKKTKIIVFIMAASCFGVMASAQSEPYDIDYKYSESRLTISGETNAPQDVVALQILNGGVKFDSGYTIDDVLHADQVITNDNNGFVFSVEFDASDSDCAAAISSKSSGQKTEFSVHLVSKEEFENAYTELNALAAADDFAGFCTYINENADDLNFLYSLTDGRQLQSELEDYYTYVKANPPDTQNEENNTKIYRTYITIYELGKNSIDNIDEYMNELYFDDDEIYALYGEKAESAEIQKFFTQKLSGKKISNLDEFGNVTKEALILTTVRYADGSDEIKNIIEKYGDVIGITNTASDSVYRQLAGKDYSSGGALKEDYDGLRTNGSNPGGGGGGSTGGNNGSTIGGGIMYDSTQSGGKEKIKITFNDIDGVQWASEAILALADKGIISGKAENVFAPDDPVTREEFAKMLIGAMGLSDEEYGDNIFSDVSSDAWYAPFVNIANKYGIVTGRDDGTLGVGDNITRQDMAVMLYRALQSRGVNVDAADMIFDDGEDISDYAKDAVSALCNLGAINGVGDNKFEPLGTATRAQAAKVIYSVLEQL